MAIESFDNINPDDQQVPGVPFPEEEVLAPASRHGFVRALEVGAVASEVAFLGGAVRYGGFGLVLAATRDTGLSAAYLAGSTALVEGAAAVSMADILHRNQGQEKNKTFQKIDGALDKVVPEGKKVSPLAAIVVTNYAGISPLLYAKQRENKSRTRKENIKTGLIATGILTGACAVQGAMIAEGLTDPTEPRVVIPVLGAFALSALGFKHAKKQLKK